MPRLFKSEHRGIAERDAPRAPPISYWTTQLRRPLGRARKPKRFSCSSKMMTSVLPSANLAAKSASMAGKFCLVSFMLNLPQFWEGAGKAKSAFPRSPDGPIT